MKIAAKYVATLAAALLFAGMLWGCVEDNVDSAGGAGSENEELAADEYGFGFTISVDDLTRVGGIYHPEGLSTAEEDYVDTEHLYVLFFNIDGIFLFQIQNATAVPIGTNGSGNDHQWFIKIPVKKINDNLISYIEQNPFKVAVLANWTFNEGPNADSTSNWDNFEFREPLDAEGNLTYDENGKLVGDDITLLAHCERDNVYESSTLKGGYDHLVDRSVNEYPHMGPYIEWVKSFHSSESKAETALRTKYEVDNHRYVNSEMKSRGTIEYHDMWRIWNLGGEFNFDRNVGYESTNSAIRTAWAKNNEAAREEFDSTVDDSQLKNATSDKYWPLKNHQQDLLFHGRVERVEEDGEACGIKIPVTTLTEEENDRGDGFPASMSYAHFYAKADGYLRVRYKIVGNAKLKAHISLYNFSPPADDTQRKHNVDARDEGKLKVQRSQETSTDGETIEVFEAFGDIPNLEQHVYIYALADPELLPEEPEESEAPEAGDEGDEGDEGEEEGEDGEDEPEVPEIEPGIIIYEIEYIESRHLYDVDREGILPSKEYPIPMYGIQDFDPIGEYWQPGVLFNLSMYNNAVKEGYNYRTVSLLRSLARVEVLINKNSFDRQPSHVFLRSMNRSARITPVDFFTPTDIIWNGYDRTSRSDVARLQHYIDSDNFAEQDILTNCAGVDTEIERIMQFGPIYIGRDASGNEPNKGQTADQKLDEYRMTTAWPFGIWEQQWGWNWNRAGFGEEASGNTIRWFDTYKPGDSRNWHGQTVPDYPHILHTRISRSDYARFHFMGEQNGYYRYVIYVPEKNITDADNPGNIADRPKVIHVELRFNGGKHSNPDENIVDNFDDNGAYRLYFTPGGRSSKYDSKLNGQRFSRLNWDNYEYDWDSISEHWPIIRNHVYRFTVDGGGPQYGGHSIAFTVDAPDQRSASWDFY